jgi:hypothetical protein
VASIASLEPPFRVAVSLQSVAACHELAGRALERGFFPIAIRFNIDAQCVFRRTRSLSPVSPDRCRRDIGESHVFTAYESLKGLFWTGALYLKMPRELPAGDKSYEHVYHIRDTRRKE